jgi:hypothetical protein
LLGLFFHPENIFIRKVDSISTDYTSLYPRRQNSRFRVFKNGMLGWMFGAKKQLQVVA